MDSDKEILEKIIDIANKNNLKIANIDITKTRISVIFKELVRDDIVKKYHDILIKL